ncbi:UrcA family protein [Sphingobium sp. Sx8-8]|uniref:UrcA family protein n=1 Tax=Sphingobium sp. Sx8-8 TaxID=2933617 RepID=UPI001F58E6F7|nr:UrcA family protein [Sphingobium sp. Sx8-8]
MNTAKMIAAFAMLAAGTAGTAYATEFESNGITSNVHYQDLDLSKAADQRALNARIRRAAVKVCPDNVSATAVKKCQIAAIAHVRGDMETAIARAETREHYADRGHDAPLGAGN